MLLFLVALFVVWFSTQHMPEFNPLPYSISLIVVLGLGAYLYYVTTTPWPESPRPAPKRRFRPQPTDKATVIVWDACNAPGCKKVVGRVNKSCLKCLGFGMIELPYGSEYDLPLNGGKPKEKVPQAPQPPALVVAKRNVYIHSYECYMGGMSGHNKAVSGRLWICSKCGDTQDVLVPNAGGCSEPDAGIDPSDLAKAVREGKVAS